MRTILSQLSTTATATDSAPGARAAVGHGCGSRRPGASRPAAGGGGGRIGTAHRDPDGRRPAARPHLYPDRQRAVSDPVYFDGGGWVIANLNVYDPLARALTNAARFIVVSVAYRQAPEDPFPAAANDACASPLRAPSLADLPPALVITDENDPLRSEGQGYARRLQAAGVQIELRDYTRVMHEFFGMTAVVPKARRAVAAAGAALRARGYGRAAV